MNEAETEELNVEGRIKET